MAGLLVGEQEPKAPDQFGDHLSQLPAAGWIDLVPQAWE
jgi:hypothetical protein